MVRRVARLSRMASAAARRSPETSVRSDASMAMSVPVPTRGRGPPGRVPARRSRRRRPSRQRGRRPGGREPRPPSATGRTSAITSLDPASAATARAVVSLSPVSRIGRRPSSAEGRDRLRGASASECPRRRAPRAPRRPRRRARRRAALLRAASRRLELGGNREPRSSISAEPADLDAAPLDRALHALAPSRPAKPSTGASRPTSARAARASAWPIGCSEASSSAPGHAEQLGAARAGGGRHLDDAHPAGRDRAGLVEDDRVDPARGLEDLRPRDQDAELRAAAGAHEAARSALPGRARTGRR